jgi:hypothetical protein
MEDTVCLPIESAARAYRKVTDERMALTVQEVSAHARLLREMHQHHLKKYVRGEFVVTLTETEERVKVKIRRPADE